MALLKSGIQFEHREILLKNKPPHMLEVSPKGEVPVWIDSDGSVIEQSLELMIHALQYDDPEQWFHKEIELEGSVHELLATCDRDFKPLLDKYKYADRHPERSMQEHRQATLFFIEQLESALQSNQFLTGSRPRFTDVAIFPFIRQYAFVDKSWFDAAPWPNLQNWLRYWLESPLFAKVMEKKPLWEFDPASSG